MLRQLREDPAIWAILEERARSLAALDQAEEISGDEMLTFVLGGGRYRIVAASSREVQPLGSYTALPGAPAFLVGLVNVRGRLIAAIDIRPLLELPATAPQTGAMLLIVSDGNTEIGLLADSVEEVERHALDLNPAPSAAMGRGVAWVRGVDDDLALHLDIELLLNDSRLIVNAEGEA